MRVMLSVLLVAAGIASTASAGAPPPSSMVDPKLLLEDEAGERRRFESKRARALMSAGEFGEYQQALKHLDCGAAATVLNTAFIREYPQFERARLKSVCGRHDDCSHWLRYAESSFDEFRLCKTLSDLADLEVKLRQRYPSIPKFAFKPWPQKSSYGDELVQRRDATIMALIRDAERDFAPAIEKLADLVGRGDVFDATIGAEFYLRSRACHLGTACQAVASRLDTLRSSMPIDRVAFLEWKATANVERPDLHKLVLGEEPAGRVPPPQAEGLTIRQLLFGEDHKGKRFTSKPAKELMSESEYASYETALKALDWDRAGALLNEAFIREYPQFARAKSKPNCTADESCKWWLIYANSEFIEYGFSGAELRFKAADLELTKRGAPSAKFALKLIPEGKSYGAPDSDELTFKRDEALGLMISLATRGHVPALERVADLVRRGDVFEASQDVEFYVLRRICEIAGSCGSASPRLETLRATIAPDRATELEKKAKERFPSKPDLLEMLLGERP